MGNFQVIVFIWARTYREIFKSALVYLERSVSCKKVQLNLIFWQIYISFIARSLYYISSAHLQAVRQSNKTHWKFKRFWNETFMGFLRQSARQELYGFSLRVNHLWFKLEKNPFCVLLFYIIGGSRHLLINLYRNLSGS